MTFILSAVGFLKALPRAVWAAIAAIIIVAGLMAYCSHQGAVRERAKMEQDIADANKRIEEQKRIADENEAKQRAIDIKKTDKQIQAELDAISNIPDARPSPRMRALNCERLRRQTGGDRDAVAAGCGSTS